MDKEFRAGLLSSMLAAGMIVALTVLAFVEPPPTQRAGSFPISSTQLSEAPPSPRLS